MGAWRTIRHRLEEAAGGVPVRYVGRPWRASTAEGYPTAHTLEQDRIALAALTLLAGAGGVGAPARRGRPRRTSLRRRAVRGAASEAGGACSRGAAARGSRRARPCRTPAAHLAGVASLSAHRGLSLTRLPSCKHMTEALDLPVEHGDRSGGRNARRDHVALCHGHPGASRAPAAERSARARDAARAVHARRSVPEPPALQDRGAGPGRGHDGRRAVDRRRAHLARLADPQPEPQRRSRVCRRGAAPKQPTRSPPRPRTRASGRGRATSTGATEHRTRLRCVPVAPGFRRRIDPPRGCVGEPGRARTRASAAALRPGARLGRAGRRSWPDTLVVDG